MIARHAVFAAPPGAFDAVAAVPGDKLFAGGFGLHCWGGRGWVTVLRGDR